MELTMTRALIRRRNLKRKVSVLVLGTALISGTAFASAQVFVSGGWNTNYIERFNRRLVKLLDMIMQKLTKDIIVGSKLAVVKAPVAGLVITKLLMQELSDNGIAH